MAISELKTCEEVQTYLSRGDTCLLARLTDHGLRTGGPWDYLAHVSTVGGVDLDRGAVLLHHREDVRVAFPDPSFMILGVSRMHEKMDPIKEQK